MSEEQPGPLDDSMSDDHIRRVMGLSSPPARRWPQLSLTEWAAWGLGGFAFLWVFFTAVTMDMTGISDVVFGGDK